MTIVSYTFTDNFTIIGNDCLRDDDLSAEALGVLCYLRSKPKDWRVMPTELAGRFKCGRDRINRILKELIGHGYIRKVRPRDPATKAWLPVEYAVLALRSQPLPENTFMAPDGDEEPPTENPSMAKEPLTENPSMANPAMANPAMGFTTLLNNDSPNTDLTKNKTTVASKATKRATDAEIDEIFEKRFWPAYPKRQGTRGKPEAMKKFRTIVRAGGSVEKIIEAAGKLAADWAPRVSRKPADAQYIPMAATWLNKGRWNDEPEELGGDDGPPTRGGETMFDLANHFENRVRETSYGQAPPAHCHDGDATAGADRLIDG